jgi:hypothetical protein
MLNLKIAIGDVSTEITTDMQLSFDGVETMLNRAIASTLQSYLSLPEADRLASFTGEYPEVEEDED